MKRMGTGDRDESQTSSVCHWLSMLKNFIRPVIAVCIVSAVFCLARGLLAQTSDRQPQAAPPAADQKQDQNIPDAPSAVQPPKPAPEAAPPQEAAPQDQAPAAPVPNE